MDDGLIQFLVIAAFVVISMMDGAARKRRKEAKRLGRLPPRDEPSDWTGDLEPASDSSEAVVPEDLWKEIAALARGEMPAAQMEEPAAFDPGSTGDHDSELEAWTAPEQVIPMETRSADLQSGYRHPDQALTHREHSQAVSTQPAPEEAPHEFVPHAPEQPSEPRKRLQPVQKQRSLLSGVRLGTGKSLRDAIIVAEVLSPPVSLRDSDWKPSF